MKQRAMGYAAVTVAMMVLIGATASAGGGTWVSAEDQHVRAIHGHNGMFFGEGANEIRLDELADGETRVVGVGEKQVTASRRGDEVTISRAAVGDRSALDMTCTIGRDSCKIITFDDDPARVMVVVEKTSTCENGKGDCEDVDVIAIGHGEATHDRQVMIHSTAHGEPGGEDIRVIRIKKTVECDDEGNCQEFEEVLGDGDANVIIDSLGDVDVHGYHGETVIIGSGGKGRAHQVLLRCSEGDTRMHVDKEEADEVFLCPKHSTPLEKVEGQPRLMRRKMKVERSGN